MEAHLCPEAVSKPWGMTLPMSALHKDESKECSLLTSADLQTLLQRPSFDHLDVCQLASSPESLFSPKANQDLALPPQDNHSFFAELFPGSLLFPSPAAMPSPVAKELAAAPAAAAAARLPTKIFEHLPHPVVPVAVVPAAARNLMQHLDAVQESEDAADQLDQPPSQKRRRMSLYQAADSSYQGMEDMEETELVDGSEMDGGRSSCPMDGLMYEGSDARLESKRARNREAARRLRLRQRQQICQLEEEVGCQYDTIQGLLGKLTVLAKEMKCSAKENDLLKQLLTSAAEVVTVEGADPAAMAGSSSSHPLAAHAAQQLPLGFPMCGDDDVEGLLSSSLFESITLPSSSPQSHYLLPKQAGAGSAAAAACSPMKLFPTHSAAPAPASPSLCPHSALPPSPFASPKKVAPSPSKPLTPQRLALRSPFAAGPRASRLSMLGVDPAAASNKAALLEQLASGGCPLQQGVARALMDSLQEEQELGGQCPEDITDAEAAQIAATALAHAQGNVNAAVMRLLAWGGYIEDSTANA